MTVVACGVDHGVDGLLNVVKGNGEPPLYSSRGFNQIFFRGFFEYRHLKD